MTARIDPPRNFKPASLARAAAIDHFRGSGYDFARSVNNQNTGDGARCQVRRFIGPVAGTLAVALVASLLVVFFGVGRWLVVEDPLEKTNAIVVLSGRMPVRAVGAARLYREGYAPQVWLTHPEEPDASLKSLNILDAGEDVFNSRVLVHEGVPASAIVRLEPQINNTADEIRVVAAQLARENGSAVIIVTSKAHTRRVRKLWQKLSGGRGRAIVRATPEDPFDPAHWWRTSSDVLEVVREGLGLINSWVGLPLRPAPR
jgi:uncharacterized SAM-binding protein YcdF (DUF218 family)